VILIIALLAGILVPTIQAVSGQTNRMKSLATIREIQNGCRLYRGDFDSYPLSGMWRKPADQGGGLVDWPGYLPSHNQYKGRHLVVMFLTGYGPDEATPGEPFENNKNFIEDDGKSGFGFRAHKRGKVCGPYVDPNKMPIRKEPNPDRLVFMDAFDHPIYYWRFDPNQTDPAQFYRAADNGNGPADLRQYVTKEDDNDFFRKDFILASPGPDRQWKAYRDDAQTDDITNFLQE